MISASQISAACGSGSRRGCPRKWAFKSIAHFPYTSGPALQFGLDLHEQAENWLRDGTPPDLSAPGRLFLEGIPYLPRPGECLVEIDLTGQPKPVDGHGKPLVIEGVPLIGYIDVLGTKYENPWVIDHKSTGKPANALTPETLREDTQGILYPFAAMRMTDAEQCYARWLYYPKNKSLVFPVDTIWSRDEIETSFHEKILPKARLLHEIKQLTPKLGPDQVGLSWVNGVPCEPMACDWTGRQCDWGDLCTRRNRQTMNLEELKAQLAQQNPQAAAPPQQPVQVAPQPSPAAPVQLPLQAAPQAHQPPPQVPQAPQQVVAVNPPEYATPAPPAPTGLNAAIKAVTAAAKAEGLKAEIRLSEL